MYVFDFCLLCGNTLVSGIDPVIGSGNINVVSKNDLVITGGNYEITAASHGLSGKDSVAVANGIGADVSLLTLIPFNSS